MTGQERLAGVQPKPDERPWELPGAVRRDCEPHRGQVLVGLGVVTVLLGLGSCAVAPIGLVSLPLALGVWRAASADLARMDAGLMDPGGRRLAEQARWDAIAGAGLPVFSLWVWGCLFVAAWLG
jgi:hypothetical protein